MDAIEQSMAVDQGLVGPGDRYRFWRAERHDALECLSATFRNHRYARHTHETFVVGVILEGCETYYLRGEQKYARAGDLCFVNPGEVHDGEPYGASFTYRMTYPSEALIREIAQDVLGGEEASGQPYFREPLVRDPEGYAAFMRAHGRLERDEDAFGGEEALVEAYALLLKRNGDWRGTPVEGGRAPEAVRLARDYLETHFDGTVDLAELAAVAGLSRYHLIRVFRRHLGLTPHAYLTDVRVRAAQERLRRGDAAADVAAACGFADQSHLTRAFKARIGVPPAAFARR